ncbi:MAG: hypothetical protein EOO15_04010 [Chitinophagaceae bacterium]|nr:MAG: hypothetical protein EOO15_04010 [Chitinophagaceae bacterium]
MKLHRPFFYLLTVFCFCACTDGKPDKDARGAKAAAPTDPVAGRIDSLKRLAQPGDLLFRLGDDMMSYSIRYLSERDPSYSHVGLLVERGGSLQVAHIGPYPDGRDTLQCEPIDSFINPVKNLDAGLYRFHLSEAEKTLLIANVRKCAEQKVHFDYAYDVRTNDKLYCTELIAKSLAAATENRIRFEGMLVPAPMRKLMYAFLSQAVPDTNEVRNRRYIALDHLYMNEHCDSVIKISLRPPQ